MKAVKLKITYDNGVTVEVSGDSLNAGGLSEFSASIVRLLTQGVQPAESAKHEPGPDLRVCPKCGDKVGLRNMQSHRRVKHPS